MRRKPQAKHEEPTPDAIVAQGSAFTPLERTSTMAPCEVCGSETRADQDERLCWVCRRLKISAWRDSEPMPAQE